MQHPSRFKTQLLWHHEFSVDDSPELVEVFDVVTVNGRVAIGHLTYGGGEFYQQEH